MPAEDFPTLRNPGLRRGRGGDEGREVRPHHGAGGRCGQRRGCPSLVERCSLAATTKGLTASGSTRVAVNGSLRVSIGRRTRQATSGTATLAKDSTVVLQH